MGMNEDDPEVLERMLNRFRRLLGELISGVMRRNTFESWEVEILLDFETCPVNPRRRRELLQAYRRAVERQLQTGPGPPMRFSDFLQLRTTRRPAIE